MARVQYAAYGSNLHPGRLLQRVPSTEFLGSAFVPDASLHFHKKSIDGSGKCNILRTGRGIYVGIYSIEESEKKLLDRIEGLGKGYNASEILTDDFGTCFTYVADDSNIADELSPYCWYRELVLLGCERLEFPASYLAEVQAIKDTRDPDEDRRRRNWALVEMLKSQERS